MRTHLPRPARRPLAAALATALAALSLAACSTLPDTAPPAVAIPARYAGAPAGGATAATPGWQRAAPADAASRGPWWQVFGDADLNRLEARVEVSNPTLRRALADLDAARAAVDFQRAGLLPTLTASGSPSRARISQHKAGSSLAGKTTPDYTAGITASWEPDLFGKLRDAVANARANAAASEADLGAVRLAIGAQLASDYFALRSLDTQQQLLDDTVSAYGHALRLLEQQLADGAIDASAVAQSRAQYEAARTQATDVGAQRARLQHAIATLVGESASTFSIAPRLQALAVPPIPVGLPSQLLERRPDIAAAERRVAAANAQIGAARAAFFPDLLLSASAGLESAAFGPWLTASSLFWSLGPQLVGTLFDGGQRRATLHGATAQYDGAVADYRQTVLGAFQQVEDDLTSLDALASEAASARRAAEASDLSLTLTTNRFQAGAVSYLDVVTAQTIALSNRRRVDQIDAQRIEAAVGLAVAVGGGWRAEPNVATAAAVTPGNTGATAGATPR
ncbi:efflux transporter outer membrane subunit [Burkholderia plantarii]|uniref:efflux transporter outer membrane subunit n=1 Tax=Burkholderia plantarii TaxID=41899 RepID=UPI0018DE20C0|nr:efflux transporter outer membrane subunit [Burkholderia plantarii]MBI0330495.1 efflux transporter outer membrane subunit [Burkholderia plantarii]